jgi:dTDP-glucose 4,6-dehydratase
MNNLGYNMKTILVTGGAGFIGSNFIRLILDSEPDYFVINLDKLTYAGNLGNLLGIEEKYPNRYIFVHGDICDEKILTKIFSDHDIDFVVNFAAESHVDRSILQPNLFIETNVLGSANLLNVAKTAWKDRFDSKRFLQVSTDEVYGTLPEDNPEIKFTESTPIQPHSPYSASKASADLLAQAYFDTFGFPVLITRCSNNYGPYQFPEKLIPLMINNAVNDKQLPVYGDGKNIRDWLYVQDHCEAILAVLQKGKLGDVYNIGGNNEIKNIDIVTMILDYLGKPHSLIKYVTDRLGHDRRYAIDASKIKNELGWEPKFQFSEKIGTTIDWYLGNKEWMENVISGEYQKYYDLMYSGR